MNADGIRRINELAAAAKTRELTEAEKSERDELRKRYIADFRAGFAATLENTSVKQPDGSVVPLKEARKANKPPEN